MIDIPKALNEVRPGEEFAMDDCTDYETLVWHSNTPKPTREEVADGWNLYANSQYQRDRKPEYGSWGDQLDMMYHGTWESHVQAVKNKHPK